MATATERVPAHVYLDPTNRRYPVKALRDGKWVYDLRSIHAAINRANRLGETGMQRRASRLLHEAFGRGNA